MGQYDKTIGTLLIGVIFNTYLYGLVTFQFIKYYKNKFKDPPAVRYTVAFLLILDTVHSAAVIFLVWGYLVTNYNNPSALSIGGWPLLWTPCATALAALCAQVLLGYRIFRSSGNKLIYGIILAMSIPAFIIGMAVGIKAVMISVLADLPQLNDIVIAWFTLQVTANFIISGKLNSPVANASLCMTITDILSTAVVAYTLQFKLNLNRAVLKRRARAILSITFPSIFSLCALATFLVLPETNLFGMFAIPLSILYTYTLLDNLSLPGALPGRFAGSMAESESTAAASGGRSTMKWAQKQTTTGIQLTDITATQQDVVSFDDELPGQHGPTDLKKSPAIAT